MTYLRTLALASILALSVTPVLAHDSGSMNGMNMSNMDMKNMKGMHEMAATVSAVDNGTGIVDVDAGGIKLRVHFPPSALADVRAGDKITLHLAFTKP